MIKAVIFDLDGVVIDSEPIHEKAWATIFLKHKVHFTHQDLYAMKGRKAVDVLKKFMPTVTSVQDIETLKNEKRSLYRAMLEDNFVVVPGVSDFIKKVKSLKLCTAVATATSRQWATHLLERAEVFGDIDVLVTSDEVKKGKPDPEIYAVTAKKLDVPPEQCLVFEDAISGVIAAQQAGTKVALIMTSHEKNDMPSVSLAFKDFTEINPELLML